MCAFQKRKLNSDELTIVLEEISKSNITLGDIGKSVELLESVTDTLIQLQYSLSSLCSVENVTQNSSEWLLRNHLQRLRDASIGLLNCKRIEPRIKNQLRVGKKRPSPDANSEAPEAKRANHGLENAGLVVQQPKAVRKREMDLLDMCYVCKRHCTDNVPKHEFYVWMCFQCGEVNFGKRSQMADLNGKIALVTGGRIKIGFEIAVKLLRCGASVIIITRFPNDARRRYELENEFSQWSSRLHIVGLDLRFLPQVDKFCAYVTANFSQLDILIQNAAQTIRRPTVYYQNLIDGERRHQPNNISSSNRDALIRFNDEIAEEMPSNGSVSHYTPTGKSELLIHPEDFKYSVNTGLTQLHFPVDRKDADGEQLDLRPKNTWVAALQEVENEEMVEVTLANYMSPFIILNKLTPLMAESRNLRSDFGFIILVSAMEGKFSDCYKTGNHPHTNAAKAALNMLVKTSARHYKKMGILMNAVDTGWITDEHPEGSKVIDGSGTPLDSIDGAARVLDPILHTVNNATEFPMYGRFLKDYRSVGW